MADFKQAFAKVLRIEGGYVNDPDDRGRETYKGISRRYHPGWPGWTHIDAAKRKKAFPDNLQANGDLQNMVRSFYHQEYWQKFWGDKIPDQDIAEELFDTSVNLGKSRNIRFLQTALNALNRAEKLYNNLKVDGRFGKRTFGALQAYLEHDPPRFLLNVINVLQGYHYIQATQKLESQEKYLRGWLKRVEIVKSAGKY